MSLSRKQEWIIRGCLVAFGALVAAAVGGIAYLIIRHRNAERGIEFANINELRASLAAADARNNGRITLGSIIEPHPSNQMIYDLRPNLAVNFQGVPVQTNSCGMRERELPRLKPKGTYRIAIIGDSFTFGWGVKEDEAFPRRLETILNKILSRNKSPNDNAAINSVEVLNFGVPGYSPFQEVATFEEKALEYDPDAVILFFIENDFGMPFFIRDVEQPEKLQASANLARLTQEALSDNDESTAPPRAPKLPREFDPNIALTRLAKVADDNAVKVFLAINPKKNWVPIHKKLWALKKNHQIHLMDFYSDFDRIITTRGYAKESLTLKHDQHPSPRKHIMLAEVMAPYFLRFILR